MKKHLSKYGSKYFLGAYLELRALGQAQLKDLSGKESLSGIPFCIAPFSTDEANGISTTYRSFVDDACLANVPVRMVPRRAVGNSSCQSFKRSSDTHR